MTIGIELNDVLRDYTGQFEYVFNKYIDNSFRLEEGEPSTFDYSEAFPFTTKKAYEDFKYVDYPYEIHGRADAVSKTVHASLNRWIGTTLDDLDVRPDVLIFSALESQITIQSTLSYLGLNMCRVREIVFPVDSAKMRDRCDAIITANPYILSSKPEGKVSVRIEMPYNNNVEADFVFANIEEMFGDNGADFVKRIEQCAEKKD